MQRREKHGTSHFLKKSLFPFLRFRAVKAGHPAPRTGHRSLTCQQTTLSGFLRRFLCKFLLASADAHVDVRITARFSDGPMC
jgi:hypothetical protein